MKLKKIVILDNEIEAQIIESILEDEEIPFVIQSYFDKAYNGIFSFQKGWGHIEAEAKYEEQIIAIYNEIKEEIREDE
jgi:3-deoxy-D-manno-octulosonic acid (KDO) 8-phosphate synthase